MIGRIKSGIDKGIASVGVRSSTYLETGKLKTKIETLVGDMEEAFKEMGKTIYVQWKEDTLKVESIETMCGHIKEMEEEVSSYQEQIERLEKERARLLERAEQGKKGATRTCACGYENEPSARFCVQCGNALSELSPQTEMHVCPACGAQIRAGANFCVNCGSRLGTLS